MDHASKLPPEQLRWRFDAATLPFKSTEEVDPATGVVGQPIALEAMRFGLECDAPGQNIYIRGLSGTGRMTLVESMLEQLDPRPSRQLDRCYVHNFAQPDRPRLLTLEAGQGPKFRRRMREAAEFIETRLADILEAPAAHASLNTIQEEARAAVESVTAPLEKDLRDNGLTLVQLQNGPITQAAVFPLVDGKPLPPDEYRQQVLDGVIDKAAAGKVEEALRSFEPRIDSIGREAAKAWQQGEQQAADFIEQEIRTALDQLFAPLREGFPTDPVCCFLREVTEDIIENRLPGSEAENLPDAVDIYGVNVVHSHAAGDRTSIITENAPTVANLLGSVEPDFVNGGQLVSNYKGIRAGALVRADGGFLALDAYDVLTEPGAWRMLMRALRTGSVEIVPAELGWPLTSQSLKPEPIDIKVRVILLGGSDLFYELDNIDQDFSDLFKVLADFDSEIERSEAGVGKYAGVIARLCHTENLPPFSADAIAAMAEHGARIAARQGKITARFSRVADIAREAAFLTAKAGQAMVDREQVEETVRRTRYRASLPSQRYQELISDGTINVVTGGAVTGQLNGLAVIHAGPLSYGFPARITATVGPGRAGVINIEGASSLSGNIHTKGFHILGGLLRFVLRSEHALAFSASIAFEQSYGGIDGDSASGAEFCCLVSALTGTPLRQGIAMTGAIDQHGHLQAIGGVNEKVDGFFDACHGLGLTGEQGVIIPAANAGDLMLRQDVVEACKDGQFHVYAVKTISEALEILTGGPVGDPLAKTDYPSGSLFDLAQQRAYAFFRKSTGAQEDQP
jgi:ATP-dependent Lon protease